MKPSTPSSTPLNALLERCKEVAQQESVLREGGLLRQGYGGQGGEAGRVDRVAPRITL